MGVFRRPELEKDNPAAPQMYVGPRRRLALARAAARTKASAGVGLAQTLAALTDAAERFVDAVPVSKEQRKERTALVRAIARAHAALADGAGDEATAE
ncbi:MAG: hypothetical protein U0412_13490 [Nitrospira sp.]|mgnify:CR=1 FL=1